SNITYEKCQVAASVAVYPSTINLNSKGKWITVVIEPTPPTTVADLDLSAILINGSVPIDLSGPVTVGDDNGNGIPDVSVKVLRSALAATYAPGDYDGTLTASGPVGKGCFEASASVHIKHATLPHPAAGSLVTPGQVVDLNWAPLNGVRTIS